MKRNLVKNTGILMLIFSLAACSNAGNKTENVAEVKADSTTNASTANGTVVSLFDGKTLSGWHAFNKTGAIKNWEIEDSAMVCLGAAKDAHGGDIVSDKEYENFELNWQWKASKGGNSGMMYHVVEAAKYQAPYETGPEYQMIDDIDFPEKLEEWQKSGADYAMNLTNDKKKLMPVGEWNTSKIIFDKGHVEHWLNGEKVVEFQAWNDEWNKKRKEGKWKDIQITAMQKKDVSHCRIMEIKCILKILPLKSCNGLYLKENGQLKFLSCPFSFYLFQFSAFISIPPPACFLNLAPAILLQSLCLVDLAAHCKESHLLSIYLRHHFPIVLSR
jgi:hypothetical protein